MSRVTGVFRSTRTGNVFAKSFRSEDKYQRAASGMATVGVRRVSRRLSKGFRYGSLIKRMNSRRYNA